MTISKEIFLAILALDSYNRGYNAGIRGLSQEDDVAIGRATIVGRKGDEAAQSIGFYATAYDVSQVASLGGAHTVVSYRGTDFSPAAQLALDVRYGWSVGAEHGRAD